MFHGLTIKHFYILVIALMYITLLIVFHFKMKDPELKEFFLNSLKENGKPSGKSLTGLFFVQIIGFATIVAIIYSKDHLLPEYFLISLLTFIGGLYGMKVASKYMNNGDTSNTQSSQTVTETEEEKKKKEEASKNNPDVG